MKLLLTSNGLSNNSIAKALFELTGKAPEDIILTFIPTASNGVVGDKGWFIDDLVNIKKQNFKSIEITDISAVGKDDWLPSLERADVLFFEGGNTYYLMRWLNKSGLAELLSELLKTRVYVGVSAGSMVTCPDLNLKRSPLIYEEHMREREAMQGLGFVDFYFLPHLNSDYFKKMRKENIAELAKSTERTIYALDDASALKIIDGKVEVVSEGEWIVFETN